jgi:RsmE family RNA methyltransferase
MNIILLSSPDFIGPSRVRLRGRRLEHIRDILKPQIGQNLIVGKINGSIGRGIVVSQNSDSLELDVKLDQKPPEVLPLTLILALPRPPMLKRILFSAAMLGVKKIIILNFNRVEKSLWNSSALKPQALEEQLVLGLEQAKDTILPEVVLKKRFKPFVQDELPALIKNKLVLVAHPGGEIGVTRRTNWGQSQGSVPNLPDGAPRQGGTAGIQSKQIVLTIGPEGGILDFEIDLLKAAGCQTLDLGPRILRTDSVLPFVAGKLF